MERYFAEFDLNSITLVGALQEKIEELCSDGNVEFEVDEDFFTGDDA